MIIVKEANSASQREQIFNIRRHVFVEEQQVDEREEYDEYETSSKHLIALIDDHPVGTCRYRNTDKGIKLERFAVLSEYRGRGVGEKLVQSVLAAVDCNQHIYLHAQVQVVDFYSKYGFYKTGNKFEEAGIQHYKMIFRG